MAVLNFTEMLDEMATILGTGRRTGDDMRVSFGRWLNQAFQRIAYALPWDEMVTEQKIVTVAPYTTGTVTFTNGSAVVTGSGTTFAAAVAGRKIALALGGPYYRILTRDSATQVTLTENYAEATVSGASYTIFQDEYDLAATTHSIEAVWPMEDESAPLVWAEQNRLEPLWALGVSTGTPAAWGLAAQTTPNTPRVRILPVPDAAYRIVFRYRKKWTPLSGTDLFTAQGLPEDVEELALDRALRWAPRVEGTRRVMTDLEWRKELHRVWSSHHKVRRRVWHRRGVVGSLGAGHPAILVDYSQVIA